MVVGAAVVVVAAVVVASVGGNVWKTLPNIKPGHWKNTNGWPAGASKSTGSALQRPK